MAWWYLAFNHRNLAFADVRVREAFALAINRGELVEAHLGRGDILSGPFLESSPFFNFAVSPRKPDVDRV